MVPLAGAGVASLRTIFPITLGCNIGTTITALLASIATGSNEALTIALCHLLFNIFGILLIYPIPFTRNGTIRLAEWLAAKCALNKIYAVVYVVGIFFLLPALILLIQNLLLGG
jgi:sodium-dependent phosphate cotransporter